MSRKVTVNLENYPNLAKLEKDEFIAFMKGLFLLADKAVAKGYGEVCRKYFKAPFVAVLEEIVEGFFDTEAILMHHKDAPIAKTLWEMHRHAMHPLYAALSEQALQSRDGEDITFEEKFGVDARDFSIRNWISGMLFAEWYLDKKEYAEALSANSFKLMDKVKEKYMARLFQIAPILEHQRDNGILVGKMIPGTGFFVAKAKAEEVGMFCPVCKSGNILTFEGYKGCANCKAGYISREDQ